MLTSTATVRPSKVVRKNGKVFRDRVCVECGIDHWHGDNMCVACRNAMYKKAGNYKYIPVCQTEWYAERQRRIAEHTKRITTDIETIEADGMDHRSATIQEIEEAGVEISPMPAGMTLSLAEIDRVIESRYRKGA